MMSMIKYCVMSLFLLNSLDIVVAQNGVCVEDTSVLLRDISLKKPANQSSLYDGSYISDHGIHGYAWKANDGNKAPNYGNGSCSHVAAILENHWWQVDLQDTYNVTTVTIVNRDKHASRLHDFGIEVSFSDQDDKNGRLKEAKLCHYHTGGGIGEGEERTFQCMAGAVGQYVRIYKQSPTDRRDVLALCEVEVSGYRMTCGVPSTFSSTVASTSPSNIADVTTPPATKSINEQTTSSVTFSNKSSSSSTITSYSASTTYPTSCSCQCENKTSPTMFELVERIAKLKKQLTVNKNKTSSYRRKFISAPDNRTSAKGIGVVLGAGVLILVFGGIVVMDLLHLKQFLTYVHRK